MFSWFNKNKITCPLEEQDRLYMETGFKLTLNGSTKEKKRILSRKILFPNANDFPIKYNGSNASATESLKIVATQMEVKPCDFILTFYDESDVNYRMVRDETGNQIRPAAIFLGENVDNKFQICVDAFQLHDPPRLVATLAHEVGYIKMLYQYGIEKIEDISAEIFPLYFGLGIFAANAPVQFYKNDQSWGGHKTQKYLTKDLWGYMLALYAFVRHEQHPEWVKYLIPEVRKYFKLSEKFIWANQEIIFNEPYQAENQ